MTLVYAGLRFEATADGGVIIHIGQHPTENTEIIRSIILSKEEWDLLKATETIVPVVEAPEEEKADLTPGTISTVPSDIAFDLIKNATTVDQLDALEVDELDNQKNSGGRKGVLAAIEKRREELKESN